MYFVQIIPGSAFPFYIVFPCPVHANGAGGKEIAAHPEKDRFSRTYPPFADRKAAAVFPHYPNPQQRFPCRCGKEMQQNRLQEQHQQKRRGKIQKGSIQSQPSVQHDVRQRPVQKQIQHAGKIPFPGMGRKLDPVLPLCCRRCLGTLRRQIPVQIPHSIQPFKGHAFLTDSPADGHGMLQLMLFTLQLFQMRFHQHRQIFLPRAQVADIFDADAQLAQKTDAQKNLHILLTVIPVAVGQSEGAQKAFLLIKAHISPLQTGLFFYLTDIHKKQSLPSPKG